MIAAGNKIKGHALDAQLFSKLRGENDEDVEHLLLHNEMCWLSKGNCVRCFDGLFYIVVECL